MTAWFKENGGVITICSTILAVGIWVGTINNRLSQLEKGVASKQSETPPRQTSETDYEKRLSKLEGEIEVLRDWVKQLIVQGKPVSLELRNGKSVHDLIEALGPANFKYSIQSQEGTRLPTDLRNITANTASELKLENAAGPLILKIERK